MPQEETRKAEERRAHHPIGMGARLWCFLECPASIHESELATSRASLDMERGSRQHDAMEQRLPQLCRTDFERIAVEQALDFEERFTKDFGEPDRVDSEARVSITRPDGTVFTYSYADRIYWYRTIGGAVVVDHKFYPASMPPEKLMRVQLAANATAILQRNPEIRTVCAVIYNPYLDEMFELTVVREQLPAILARYRKAEERAGNEPTTHITGSHCRYCPALGHCPAAPEHVSRAVEVIGPDSRGAVISIDADGAVTIVDEEKCIAALEWVKIAEQRIEEFKTLVKAAAQTGAYERIRLKNSGSTRSYRDPEQAWDRVPADVRALMRPPMTPPAVERAWQEARGVSAKKAREEASMALGDLLVEKPKSPSIQVSGETSNE